MAKINRVAIYDMDGTIVDSSARYRTIIDNDGERIDLPFWQPLRRQFYHIKLGRINKFILFYFANVQKYHTFVAII